MVVLRSFNASGHLERQTFPSKGVPAIAGKRPALRWV
jgi:hypothetical protein